MKKYSKPTNPTAWGKFQKLIIIFLVLRTLGNIVSGSTEYYHFYNTLAIDHEVTRQIAALALTVLIELSFITCIAFAFENLFDFIKNTRSISDLVLCIVFAGASLAIGYISIDNSVQGKTAYVEATIAPPDTAKADLTTSTLLQQEALQKFKADSLIIVANTKTAINANINKLEAKKKKALANINWLKKTGKEGTSSYWTTYNTANKEIKQLQRSEDDKIALALAPAKSEYYNRLKIATATKSEAVAAIGMVNNQNFSTFTKRLDNKQSSLSFAVYLSVLLGALFGALKHYAYFISGRQKIYIINPISYSTNPFSKLLEGLKVKIYNLLTIAVDSVVGNDIQVNDTEIQMKKKQIQIDTTILDAEEANTDTDTQSVVIQDNLYINTTNTEAVPVVLDAKYFTKVRSWYYAAHGLKNRGKTEASRKKNKDLYTMAKDGLIRSGYEVIESPETVIFKAKKTR